MLLEVDDLDVVAQLLSERQEEAAEAAVDVQGNPAVEGQLSGAPVVAAASGGLLDVVTDGRTGRTFAPGAPDALARAIEAVLADREGTARMALAARDRAAARFGTAGAAKAYAAVYAGALQGRGG